MSMDIEKYREDYIRESKEHLDAINQAILQLEKDPSDLAPIADAFRHAHTLKSMSGAMKYHHIETLCHQLENLLNEIQQNKIEVTPCIDLLFESCDFLSSTISAIQDGKSEENPEKLLNKLVQAGRNQVVEGKSNHRVAVDESQRVEKIRIINVKVERLDQLMNLSEEFLINKIQVDMIQSRLGDRDLSVALEHFDHLINELQFLVVQSRLVPLEYIFNRFPRMVRDLAKKQNKKIDIQIQGGAIELDRAIVDELGECIVHLLRNAVDHGIESKEKRSELKKFEISTITINALRQRDKVIISIGDDGSGLSIEKIRKKAQEKRLISDNASEKEVVDAIFSNLSTEKQITNVSGRGFGLNIVKQKIDSLGGKIQVTTEKGKGVTFTLELPLTLAIIRVLFIHVNQSRYAIPISSIVRLVRFPKNNIKQMMHSEAIVIENKEIPVIRLQELFSEEKEGSISDKTAIVIVRHNENLLGLAVDQFGIMQDVVVKPMHAWVRKNRFFSGSTLMGSGEAVLILDVLSIGQAAPSIA